MILQTGLRFGPVVLNTGELDVNPLIPLAVYAVLNILAFGMFIWDKRRAQNDQWRVRESTLLILAFFGPFGATAGMLAARHKTRKLKFKLVYAFLVLHIVLMALFVGSALF